MPLLMSVLLTFAMPGEAAPVQTAATQASASPLLGRWSLDITTLPFPPDARPKRVVMTLREVDAGHWAAEVEIIARGGVVIRSAGTMPLDGTPSPMQVGVEADHVSITLPQPNMLIMALSKAGTPGTTRIYTLTPGGDAMTETHVYVAPNGQLAQRTVTWRRVS